MVFSGLAIIGGKDQGVRGDDLRSEAIRILLSKISDEYHTGVATNRLLPKNEGKVLMGHLSDGLSQSPNAPQTLAAVDIGSNAIRLAVAQVLPEGEIEMLEHLQRGIRLGHETFRRGRLSVEVFRSAVNILRDFRRVLSCTGCGTSTRRGHQARSARQPMLMPFLGSCLDGHGFRCPDYQHGGRKPAYRFGCLSQSGGILLSGRSSGFWWWKLGAEYPVNFARRSLCPQLSQRPIGFHPNAGTPGDLRRTIEPGRRAAAALYCQGGLGAGR